MKRMFACAAVLLVSVLLRGSDKRVLVIGDNVDPETLRHVAALASEQGSEWEFRCVPDMDSADALRRDGWDAVVLTDHAQAVSARRLGRRMRGAKVYLQQEWAYACNYYGEPCLDPRFAAFGYDQKRMYDSLMVQSQEDARRTGAILIPVGTAVQNVRSSFDRDNLTLDGVRLNHNIGCYLAACTWFELLSGADVRNSSYDPGRLRAERAELARCAAHAAVEQPFAVSAFGFKKLNKTYEEADVPQYTLPDPLVMSDGTPVTSPEQWYGQRRPELFHLFETEMYGRAPGRPEAMHFELVSMDDGALGGTAVRKEINIYFTEGREHYMTLLLYVPKQCEGPVPAVLGANFKGNASVIYDEGVSIPDSLSAVARYCMYREPVRGSMQSRWPVGMILSRGYAFATFFKGDLDPEWDDSFANGVHGLFYREGQDYPDPDEWGSIAAWAWGYSRALDYLETDADVDAARVATVGHSRLAKTALWAAVADQRFAMAFPNNPGCAGGAISRRAYGETLETIIRHYHYWFCPNFAKYACHEDQLPFDQHELLALMAPRPVYVASGQHDRWSDPKGEFIALTEASKVYEFLGLDGLGIDEMPGPWRPVHNGRVGYHMRSGPHELTTYDWSMFLDFADRFMK